MSDIEDIDENIEYQYVCDSCNKKFNDSDLIYNDNEDPICPYCNSINIIEIC